MGDDDDVSAALAFLRKHDASKTGAPTTSTDLADLVHVDLENGEAIDDVLERERKGHEPVGPNWKKPGNFAQLPNIKGHPDNAWLMHERQVSSGKYRAWLFFSTKSGQYYRLDDLNDPKSGYTLMPTPHDPWLSPLNVRVGSASIASAGAPKLDMTVLLPDLPRTSFLLKQPLEFLDKPASLLVLCAGLRKTALAAEFCAKRFHTLLLPKLSSRATVWYDYELVEVLQQSAKELDKMLLESQACFAGCSLAVAVLAGTRLCVASLGGVRCLLCRPGVMKKGALGPAVWTAKSVGGTDALARQETDESASNCGGAGAAPPANSHCLYANSARADELEAAGGEWERELLRTTRATNSFAALGLTPAELEEGSAAVRRSFRRRSLIVHPDKVTDEARRGRTGAIFARLEAAADAVEALLRADASAARRLAEILGAHDDGSLVTSPAAAAKLLGVPEGCDRAKAETGAKKHRESFEKLQHVSRDDVERALFVLGEAVHCVARGTQAWNPAGLNLGVAFPTALGCKDLKAPKPLVTAKLSVEIVQLALNEPAALVLLTDGADCLPDATVASMCAEHSPGRPRAAALRLALNAAGKTPGKPASMVSVVCAHFHSDGDAPGAASSGLPHAKRARMSKPERVRVSHILLRWAGLKVQDEFERPNWRPPTRSQAEAERTLLELMERLLAKKDPKTLGQRFKAEILRLSECSTALNVPHADLGWLEPGGAEPPLETAAFDTAVGGLSDVVVTSRGAHLMYRLA